MQSIDRNSIVKALRNFRFIVINSNDEDAVIEYLRGMGIANLFQVHRVGNYTIIEPNTAVCERECSPYCIENDGRKASECRISCVNTCIDEEVEYILGRLS